MAAPKFKVGDYVVVTAHPSTPIAGAVGKITFASDPAHGGSGSHYSVWIHNKDRRRHYTMFDAELRKATDVEVLAHKLNGGS